MPPKFSDQRKRLEPTSPSPEDQSKKMRLPRRRGEVRSPRGKFRAKGFTEAGEVSSCSSFRLPSTFRGRPGRGAPSERGGRRRCQSPRAGGRAAESKALLVN